ncbi:GTPase [Streptomyces sp. NPDC002734]|uniref:GTPase n=1 Tax=Streptomyces sp. NPDC002734 TaxID=3154426 RepID=UPI0033325A8F
MTAVTDHDPTDRPDRPDRPGEGGDPGREPDGRGSRESAHADEEADPAAGHGTDSDVNPHVNSDAGDGAGDGGAFGRDASRRRTSARRDTPRNDDGTPGGSRPEGGGRDADPREAREERGTHETRVAPEEPGTREGHVTREEREAQETEEDPGGVPGTHVRRVRVETPGTVRPRVDAAGGGVRAEDRFGVRRGAAAPGFPGPGGSLVRRAGLATTAPRPPGSPPLISRVTPSAPAASTPQAAEPVYGSQLRGRLEALRELIGMSRARLDSRVLAEAGQVLDRAAERGALSGRHTVVAIAGASGSGKSQLFNALAGVAISETGVRRPTTAAALTCSWSDGAAPLIDRLGIPGRLRRRPLQNAEDEQRLNGLVLVDLPDHDSAAVQHREQVDRLLKLVDAVIWVVDPEKYADAVLHERYLRPMAGHAEITFVVLNQVDRLSGEAADQVLDDLRRLLDEDGIALSEHGEPGATVLALSALTGDGVDDLKDALGRFVRERGAAARRIAADVDAAAARLRPAYTTGARAGLSEEAQDEFADGLAAAVGSRAAGEAAERAWMRGANQACGTPWLRLWRWYQGRRAPLTTRRFAVSQPADDEATARQRVEQAVRTVTERACRGMPEPWAQAVREAALRAAEGLPEELDELSRRSAPPGRTPRPFWWPAAVLVQAAMTLVQVVGGLWLLGQIVGVLGAELGVPVLLMVIGIVGGPAVEWACRAAARAPARRYGLEAELLLREAAEECGRIKVLEPIADEVARHREVREQYGVVSGAVPVGAGGLGGSRSPSRVGELSTVSL